MHEIIALGQRIKARQKKQAVVYVVPFSLERIVPARFAAALKAPDKRDELRPSRPTPRPQSARLRPSERTRFEKLARRVHRAGKLRLFRLWKLFGERGVVGAPVSTTTVATATTETAAAAPETITPRPLAERLAWLRRTRRL